MAEYKNTYPFEAEYLDGTKETIPIPRMSSEAFFDAYLNPKVLEIIQKSPEAGMMAFAKLLVEKMAPGVLKRLTVRSGFALLTLMIEKEAGAMSLGEAEAPSSPEDQDGQSETATS